MNIKKGDIIDIIAPASPITKGELAKILKFLEKHQLQGRFLLEDELILEKKPKNLFPTFTKELRIKQFKQAIQSDSKAIWCARGGYGSSDLLPLLHFEEEIPQNKLFIGFSDLSALGNFLIQNWNYKIIYGPMLSQLAFKKLAKKSEELIFELIFNGKKKIKYEISPLNNYQQRVKGILVGGCLSVLMQNIGTVNQINWHNKILFLEDIDESGEKLDRYFMQILQICKFQNSYPKAILLGNFYENVKEKQRKTNIDFAIQEFVRKIDESGASIPLFIEKENCLGHSKNISPIILGKETTIENNKILQF